MPHFAVVTADGETVGAFHLNGHDWPPGSVIYRGSSEPNLRVVDVLPSDDPEKFVILVVEEACGYFDQLGQVAPEV
jgi:hypothetical protein